MMLQMTNVNNDLDGFKALGLDDKLSERLHREKIFQPTPIQIDLFKPIQDGVCVLGLAKTGTGKTLSYLAPLVQKYSLSELDQQKSDKENAKGPIVFVLVPTRELASQVQSTFVLLTEASQHAVVVVGGESEEKQIDAMGQAQFVIATPGRLLDLLKRKKISTHDVEVVVMDEADRLLDMGFIDDIRAILKFLKKPQLVCVSATLHLGVEEVAYEMGLDPVRYGVEEAEMTVKGLDHRVAHVGDREKFHALVHFIHERKDKRGIVFSNYRDRAHEVASRLRGLGCKADALSAQLSQSLRKRITDSYRSGETMVLVASDLAARGLDFLDIDYVINFDLPEDPATYVHRVGRTARAGREGRALSLLGFEDVFRIEKLEKFLGEKIEVENFDPEKLSGQLPRFAPRDALPANEDERHHSERPHSGRQHSGRPPQGKHHSGRDHSSRHQPGRDGPDNNRGRPEQKRSQANPQGNVHGNVPGNSQKNSQRNSQRNTQTNPQKSAAIPSRRVEVNKKSEGILSKLFKKMKRLFGVVPVGAASSSGDTNASKESDANKPRHYKKHYTKPRAHSPRRHVSGGSHGGSHGGPSSSTNSNSKRRRRKPRKPTA